MAQITPFAGLSYRLEKPEDLERFVSPPYDMIDGRMIDELYEKDPHNVVRIIQNRALPSDPGNAARHLRAAELFRQWEAQGVLQRDAAESVYIYRQEFSFTQGAATLSRTRTGAIVLVKLVDYDKGVVSPHEYTLSGPKIDRYELLRAIKSHTELIFGIVPDEDRALFTAVSSAPLSALRGTFVDPDGVRHSLYRCNDPSLIASLTKAMEGKSILIADGHHRYETALEFLRDTQNPAYGRVMMNLVSMADPGLVIRAFHRLLKKYPGTENLSVVKALPAYFDLTDLGAASLEAVQGFLGGNEGRGMLYADSASKRLFGLSLNGAGERYLLAHAGGKSPRWTHLDVSEINLLVVQGTLGLALDGKVLHDVMDYINDAPAAFAKALSGPSDYHGAFFIRPVDIGEVNAIVEGRERMPQKSTNFFPKCYSGLVFNKMERA